MSWFYLLLAIILEVAGTTSAKLSQGFNNLLPTVIMYIMYALSLTTLVFALKKIEVSIAYAIWSGLGTGLIALIGILWFKETASALKLTSLLLIVAGVIGLSLCE
ncbi:MAG: multidrug efflux SMR transporter [Clostridia bacterium]|nr:multidrug efflux SMR transporter [Clostridia bacterium]